MGHIARWKGALVATGLIVAVIGAMESAFPQSTQIVQSPASSPPERASDAPAPPTDSKVGLRIHVPPGWTFNDEAVSVNRAVFRHFFLSSQALEPPTPTSTWSGVADDAVVLELWEYVGPPAMSEPGLETEFPIAWSAFEALNDSSGREARRLMVQHALRPLAFVAHLGPSARPQDRATLEGVIASVRSAPVPAAGMYHGAHVAGPMTRFRPGSIATVGVGNGRETIPMFILGARTRPLALHTRAFRSWGGMFACPLRYDEGQRMFICDATGDRWSRVGAPLTATPSFGMEWAPTAIRNEKLLIRPTRIGGRQPRNEAAEFGDAVTPSPAAAMSRAEIVARARALSADGRPTTAEAKLVGRADLTRTFPAIRVDGDPVWVALVTRDMRVGRDVSMSAPWTLFVFDRMGTLVTAACCVPELPPGFQVLADGDPDAVPAPSAHECPPSDEKPLVWDRAARECAWNAYEVRRPFRWDAVKYTIEGDPTPEVLRYDGHELHLTRDMRSDNFSTSSDRRILEWRCRSMTKQAWATDATRYFFLLSDCTGPSRTTNAG